ncbi:MAG: glycosyltransferase family 39 protein [Myxococcales bacterium]|nr:glycosyltransferase family 39 protein [Myxococcales bacterium]
MPEASLARPVGWSALWSALAACCVWGFWSTGRFHGGYELQVVGLNFLPVGELVFYMWYAAWGIPGMVFALRALCASGLAQVVASAIGRVPERAHRWVLAAAGFVVVASLVFHFGATAGLPLSDDEDTYLFIAQTLLRGRLVNPLPEMPEFFRNVFVLINSGGWYGKYPIGHPAVLAVGEAVGLRVLVVPILGGLNVWLSYLVGLRFFDRTTACFGALLLSLSPHFVFTHGTQMSQPTSMACMLFAAWALLRAAESRSLWFAVASGVGWGAAVLVRPLPGGLFLGLVPVAFLAHTLRGSDRRVRQRRWLQLVLAGIPAVVFLAVLLGSLFLQSGDPLESGYHAEANKQGEGRLFLVGASSGLWASSLGGALLRESFWFLGFPLGLLFVFWARPARLGGLYWGLLIAIGAYRVLVPKTGMSVTGPIYVTEALPLLSMGTVDVLRRLSRSLTPRLSPAPGAHPGTGAVALVLAGVIMAATIFVPVQLGPIRVSTELSGRVYGLLAERGVTRALVFANRLTSQKDRRTWAFFPPNPSPDLDDDLLFVRVPDGTASERRAACVAFWRRFMPDRRAFLFVPELRELHLVELE